MLALFLADGGWSYFTNIRDVTTGAGIVVGLVGSDLLLVTLLLAARLPVIDRAIGFDRSLAAHRRLGKPVLYLILAHLALLLLGYGLALGRDPVTEAIAMITQMNDMPQAFIALTLLVLVVTTSLVIVRHRMPYLTWFSVHLLTYAAVLLALPHQFGQGELFAEGTWARGYWLALYVGTLAALTTFRIVIPLARNLRHRVTVADVRAEAPGVASITMTGRSLDRLPVRSGQFFNWRFGSPGLRLEDIDVPPEALTVILRGDDEQHVYLRTEIEELCSRVGARLVVLVGLPPAEGHTWLPSAASAAGTTLATLAPDINDADLFVCGPKPWTELVIRDARAAGVPRRRIHAERFDW